jgi:hypothetical protein
MMRPDPLFQPRRRLGGMLRRKARVLVLLVSLPGCAPPVPGGGSQLCLQQYPNDIRCCEDGWRISNGVCCPEGTHGDVDVEHTRNPLWQICIDDEHAGTDAGADAHIYADAGLVDAP